MQYNIVNQENQYLKAFAALFCYLRCASVLVMWRAETEGQRSLMLLQVLSATFMGKGSISTSPIQSAFKKQNTQI